MQELTAVAEEPPVFCGGCELVNLAPAFLAADDGFVHAAKLVERQPPGQVTRRDIRGRDTQGE
jgi:hypothetical protein